MIQNPEATFYRYDPYQQKLFLDSYDLDGMKTRRLEAILKTRDANHIGIIMGTLGRQGSPHILN